MVPIEIYRQLRQTFGVGVMDVKNLRPRCVGLNNTELPVILLHQQSFNGLKSTLKKPYQWWNHGKDVVKT